MSSGGFGWSAMFFLLSLFDWVVRNTAPTVQGTFMPPYYSIFIAFSSPRNALPDNPVFQH
jgi:hypothetical protein